MGPPMLCPIALVHSMGDTAPGVFCKFMEPFLVIMTNEMALLAFTEAVEEGGGDWEC